MENKFKVGDKVVVTNKSDDCHCWDSGKEKYIGMAGVIKKICHHIVNTCPHKSTIYYDIEFPDEFYSYYTESCLALITKNEVKVIDNNCPRCQGTMIEKEAQDIFTGVKYNVNKCTNCGYC